ncbi:hypothetical protein OG474_22510 [Kribbella sp. NBC_01505]|uniref:hypothetical protein n=1 Tax=Kribbella sp. NBC_01505 TaxID=2903580 RepID=UPI0038703727
MTRLIKYAGIAALVIGSIWFVVSCGTTLSGDMCGSQGMEPGDVCVDQSGNKETYDEKVAAKERAPEHMKSAGAIFVVGLAMSVLSELLPVLAERKRLRQNPEA